MTTQSSTSASQLHASFHLGDQLVDARRLRLRLEQEGVLPRVVVDSLSFFGHRHSLNLVSIKGTGNAASDLILDIAGWLARDQNTFVPTSESQQTLMIEPSDRQFGYVIPSIVLRKSAEPWEPAKDKAWQQAYCLRRIREDIKRQGEAFGIQPALPEISIQSIGKTLPVKIPVRGNDGSIKDTTVLCATNIAITTKSKFSGTWCIGPLPGLGFGRIAFEAPLITVEEALEALA